MSHGHKKRESEIKATHPLQGIPGPLWANLSFSYLSLATKPLTSSVQFSRSVVSNSLWPHESQHVRPPCPSLTPWVYSNSSPLSWWCHPTISSSVVPFSSCPQSLPASGSFPMNQLFACYLTAKEMNSPETKLFHTWVTWLMLPRNIVPSLCVLEKCPCIGHPG